MDFLELRPGRVAQDFRSGGLKALDLRYSPGRPHRLTPEQEQPVVEVVTVNTVGFSAKMHGTAPLVRDYIQTRFEVTYSERGAGCFTKYVSQKRWEHPQLNITF